MLKSGSEPIAKSTRQADKQDQGAIMQKAILLVLFCGLLSACERQPTGAGQREGTSGAGVNYSRGSAGKDDQQRAMEKATDTRPRGGSMAGAGGAGPGYDGSGQGSGKHGT